MPWLPLFLLVFLVVLAILVCYLLEREDTRRRREIIDAIRRRGSLQPQEMERVVCPHCHGEFFIGTLRVTE